jgi:hypothetical protein
MTQDENQLPQGYNESPLVETARGAPLPWRLRRVY